MPKKYRSAMATMRTGVAPIRIETGLYERPALTPEHLFYSILYHISCVRTSKLSPTVGDELLLNLFSRQYESVI